MVRPDLVFVATVALLKAGLTKARRGATLLVNTLRLISHRLAARPLAALRPLAQELLSLRTLAHVVAFLQRDLDAASPPVHPDEDEALVLRALLRHLRARFPPGPPLPELKNLARSLFATQQPPPPAPPADACS